MACSPGSSFLSLFISDISPGFACERKVVQWKFCSLQQRLQPGAGPNSRAAMLEEAVRYVA